MPEHRPEAAATAAPSKPAAAAPFSEPAIAAPGGPASASAAPATPTMRGAAAAPGTPTASTAGARKDVDATARWVAGARPWLYTSLSIAYVSMAALALLAPGLVVKLLFGSSAEPLEDQHRQLLSLHGGALLVAAGVVAALACGRGEWERAGTRGADLLKLALAGEGLADVLTCAYYARTLRASTWPLLQAANAATLTLPALDLAGGSGARGLLRELGARLAPRRGPMLATAYLVLAWLFPLSGALLFYAPKFSLAGMFGYAYGASTFLLAKLAGVADKALIPTSLLVLKVAAMRGALASRPARFLSAGLLLAATEHMRVLLPVLRGAPVGLVQLTRGRGPSHYSRRLPACWWGCAAPDRARRRGRRCQWLARWTELLDGWNSWLARRWHATNLWSSCGWKLSWWLLCARMRAGLQKGGACA